MKTLNRDCICVVTSVNGGTPQEWSSRVIYQLLTDRFALTNNATTPCPDITTYCGGTFVGVEQHLDYIQGMGFDAIWISPIVTNTPGGYHGYWQQDIYTINSNFGTDNDLLNLIGECHKRGIWVMLDVVANHVGPVDFDYSTIVPFNQDSHYHGCSSCPSQCTINVCIITNLIFQHYIIDIDIVVVVCYSLKNFNDQSEVEICRLSGLPDLDQNNTFVREALVNWIKNVTEFYGFDGIRIDTVPEVDQDFWIEYTTAAGVYSVGEVYNGDVEYVASYQPVIDGLLSYPLFFVLRSVFAQQQSMYQIQSMLQQYNATGLHQQYLGTFIDNQDQIRFLNEQSDIELYKNALTYILTSEGIPIVYYGSEQAFNGGADPDNRETLWTTGFNTDSTLYQFIRTVVLFVKQQSLYQYPQIQRYADDSFYAFTRGDTFVALTNGGSNQGQISRTITYQPYQDGTTLCNIFWPTEDCIKVVDGQFTIYLDNGESKIYYPLG
ncbi:putative alpha-amylase [Heterostelium album PN500]|uniref:alpha-amylase n=1 Tax=Heterostelium pallidum (strain ATCC 26659 / Pp 5 / PN500) TaxID=670386 RepID=D3BMX7_HETP5|nr:putative alpha-amylase [Heterostelium album PN500]EFA77339.1 putative alpha-amylase [Heterostelium album PN500]|eukprot:XP_020429468.1 putative alpha-amylase [Heterostelium album PN500]